MLWSQLWARYPGARPDAERPAIDLAQEMLVGFFGYDARGCAPRIDSVETVGIDLRVHYVDGPATCAPPKGPPPGVVAPAPAHIVKVPRVEGTVEFVRVPEVDWRVIVNSSSFGANVAAGTEVIDDAASWAQAWAQVYRNTVPPALPAVDFSTRIVVGIHLGMRPTGCHGLSIPKIVEGDVDVTVFYRELWPPAGILCGAMVAYPSAFISIPRGTKPVKFVAA